MQAFAAGVSLTGTSSSGLSLFSTTPWTSGFLKTDYLSNNLANDASLWLPRRRTINVTLWAAMIVGTALWGYGLFVTGTAPIIDWTSNAPWWIADYLPNMESELGLVLLCLGSLAPHWPRRP